MCAAGIASGTEKLRRISNKAGFERVVLVHSVKVGKGEVEHTEVNNETMKRQGVACVSYSGSRDSGLGLMVRKML